MRRPQHFVIVFLTAVGLACAPAPVEENLRGNPSLVPLRGNPSLVPLRGNPYGDVIAQLTELIEVETARLNVPSLSIALVDDQHIVWQRGFGSQNAAGVPASENTVYRVGSLSKVVTATAVVQAAEKGLVDLDAPITDYLPELVFVDPFDSEQAITLRHLHAHRAGILRESPVGHYFDTTVPSIEEAVKSIIGTELIHPVGSTTKYSNMGPTVAALVLERVTGVPFKEYVRENILDALGMTSSSFLRDREAIHRNLADAYMIGFDGEFFPAPVFELGALAAGNLYSTVGDMSRFIMMFFDQGMAGETRILAPETVEDMMTLRFPNDDGGRAFGIGFMVGDLDGRKLVSHAGAIYGFASIFVALPEEKLAVVVLNDVDLANGLDGKIASQALRLMLNAKTGAGLDLLPEAVDPPAAEIEALVGAYVSGDRPAFATLEGGTLQLQLDGTTRIIRQVADGSFISDGHEIYGGAIQFVRSEGGAVTGFESDDRVYTRVEGYRPDRTVPPKWQPFVGDYGWPHNVMRIFVLDGDLWCRVEWAFEYPMIEVSDGVFAFPDYGLYSNERLVFERGADGVVSGADMATVPFPRIEGP
ncbi:MAG: serine hydrolase [bacterium]|nr:serine hydrolase [bacterium]